MAVSQKWPWPTNSVVSTPGQLGPSSRGYGTTPGWYLWGLDVGSGGQALYFVPGDPGGYSSWPGAVNVGSATEADRIIKALTAAGALIGRPGTEFAGAKVQPPQAGEAYGTLSDAVPAGTPGPAAPSPQQQYPAQQTQQTQQTQQFNPFSPTTQNGGTAMAVSINPALVRQMNEQLKRILYGQYILRISGNYTPANPATGFPLKVLGTAITAAGTDTTAAKLTDTNDFRQAVVDIQTAWFDYQRIANLVDQQGAMFEALASGDQMAVWMQMMQQQTAALTGAYGI